MRLEAPASDEVEVSIFGPGYGECVLVHLGAGEWLIVDSCLDQRSQRQPALAYLEAIGVDPASAVTTVLVTHWHTDHVRGVSEIVRECVSAEFWMSQALRSPELLLATRRFGSDRASKHNPFREFYAVIEMLEVRKQGGTGAPAAAIAGARTVLWRRPAAAGSPDCEVLALSPSPASVMDALAALASQFPDALQEVPYDVDEPAPNEAAVAVAVRVGGARILLGSDLEDPPPADRGWKAILASPLQPDQPAAVFKVAHHGSHNADNDDVWNQLLEPEPWAVITPFRRGVMPLPRPSDIERIQQHTDRVYLTAGTRRLKAAPKPRRIRLAMIQSAIRVEDEEGIAGHVRLRSKSSAASPGDWTVELGGPARHAPKRGA